jgi:hypothetical protein
MKLALIAGAAVLAGAIGTGVASATTSNNDPVIPRPSGPPEIFHGESYTNNGVYTWQTGTVTSRSGNTLTVRSTDGTTWTWTLNDKTQARKDGDKISASSITEGSRVMIGGPDRTAAIIHTPPPFEKIRERMKDLPRPPF